jgi:hypothetical protein
VRGASVIALALLASACSQPQVVAGGQDDAVDVFVGDLVSLNGQDVRGSNIGIRLVAAGADKQKANHYFLSGGCRDHGFLDSQDGRFWSGTTPEKNGEMAAYLKSRDRSVHCLTADVERYHQIVSLMEEGAALSYAEDRASITFTTPSNKTAEFEHRASLMID